MGCCASTANLPADARQLSLKFDMWVLPMAELINLPKVPPRHQALREAGLLVPWGPSMRVTFVSHEWLTPAHPDPQGKQLNELRQLLRNLRSGKTALGANLELLVAMGPTRKLATTARKALLGRNSYVWLDWFSVPQLPDEDKAGETTEEQLQQIGKQQQDAIGSITEYARLARHFLILCPTLTGQATSGAPVVKDFASWHSRGWCRAEQTFFFLSCEAPLIVVRSARCAYFSPATDVLHHSIARGVFSVPADRARLGSSLAQLFQELESQLSEASGPKLERLRILCALRQKLLKDLHSSASLAKLPATMANLNPWHEADLFADNFGLLQYGAVSNDPSLIDYAIYMGGKPDARLRRGIRGFFLPRGMTALSLASSLAGTSAVAALLEADASPHLVDSSGLAPLHYAAGRHGPTGREILAKLLEARAEVNQQSGSSRIPPLQVAAFTGSLDSASLLLRHRADVRLKASTGTGVLGVVALGSGSAAMAKLLLERGADLEETCQPDCTISLLSRFAGLFGSIGGAAHAWRVLHELPGSTLLHLAALQGQVPLCKFFCEQGLVSAAHFNCNGKTAADLALEGGFQEVMRVLIKAR